MLKYLPTIGALALLESVHSLHHRADLPETRKDSHSGAQDWERKKMPFFSQVLKSCKLKEY